MIGLLAGAGFRSVTTRNNSNLISCQKLTEGSLIWRMNYEGKTYLINMHSGIIEHIPSKEYTQPVMVYSNIIMSPTESGVNKLEE